MGNQREKEKGRLHSVILVRSLDINHLSAGTTQTLGMDLKPSRNMKTGRSHGTDPAMLHSNQLEANRLLGNLINLGANS